MNVLSNASETTQAGTGLIARDAGTSEVLPVPTGGGPDHAAVDAAQEQAQLMSSLGIRHEGRCYCFRNYCSVRLQDAVAYARLVAKRELYAVGRRQVETPDTPRRCHSSSSSEVK